MLQRDAYSAPKSIPGSVSRMGKYHGEHTAIAAGKDSVPKRWDIKQ